MPVAATRPVARGRAWSRSAVGRGSVVHDGRGGGTLAGMPPGSLYPLPCPDGYVVHPVPSVSASKRYVCPGCDNAIAAGHGHAVAWPDGLERMRRHWHATCWRTEVARGGPTAWRAAP